MGTRNLSHRITKVEAMSGEKFLNLLVAHMIHLHNHEVEFGEDRKEESSLQKNRRYIFCNNQFIMVFRAPNTAQTSSRAQTWRAFIILGSSRSFLPLIEAGMYTFASLPMDVPSASSSVIRAVNMLTRSSSCFT